MSVFLASARLVVRVYLGVAMAALVVMMLTIVTDVLLATGGAAAAAGHLPALYRVGETLALRGETAGAMGVWDTFIDAYNQGRARTAAELLAVGQAVARLGARDPSLFQDAVRRHGHTVTP